MNHLKYVSNYSPVIFEIKFWMTALQLIDLQKEESQYLELTVFLLKIKQNLL